MPARLFPWRFNCNEKIHPECGHQHPLDQIKRKKQAEQQHSCLDFLTVDDMTTHLMALSMVVCIPYNISLNKLLPFLGGSHQLFGYGNKKSESGSTDSSRWFLEDTGPKAINIYIGYSSLPWCPWDYLTVVLVTSYVAITNTWQKQFIRKDIFTLAHSWRMSSIMVGEARHGSPRHLASRSREWMFVLSSPSPL